MGVAADGADGDAAAPPWSGLRRMGSPVAAAARGRLRARGASAASAASAASGGRGAGGNGGDFSAVCDAAVAAVQRERTLSERELLKQPQ